MHDSRTFDVESRTLSARRAAPVVIPLTILLAAILFVTVRSPTGGDRPSGRAVSSYGFDMTVCLVPRDRIAGTEAGKGGVPPLDNPQTLRGADVSSATKLNGIFTLVSSDRVIGVALGGEARAYPLWIMEAHEVCNDVVGGTEIAVTYNPLCDSAVVFERAVGAESLQFAASGMHFNSNLLMYDRRASAEDESLWSQLQFRAVTGPAASRGATLRVLPCVLVNWGTWKQRHPETTVALPEMARRKAYRPNAFGRYFVDPKLRYNVDPLPPTDRWGLKTPMVALREADGWKVYPAGEFGSGAAAVDRPVAYAFWFAWYAVHESAPAAVGRN